MEAEGSGYLEQGEGDGLLGDGFKDHLFITSWGSELCDEVSAPVGLEKQAHSALASVDLTPRGGGMLFPAQPLSPPRLPQGSLTVTVYAIHRPLPHHPRPQALPGAAVHPLGF